MTGREQPSNKYVIDTNVIIDTMQGMPEAANFMSMIEATETQVLYSVIVEAELFSSHLLTAEDKTDLRRLLNLGDIIDVDSEVALKAAEIRALSRELYRRKMKLPNSLVTATLLYSANLATRNTDDFRHLQRHGLSLSSPFAHTEE